MKHLVNVFYCLRRKPVFQHLLIHGQKHLRCEFAQFYDCRRRCGSVPNKKGVPQSRHPCPSRYVFTSIVEEGAKLMISSTIGELAIIGSPSAGTLITSDPVPDVPGV